jgi:hypothetical protein
VSIVRWSDGVLIVRWSDVGFIVRWSDVVFIVRWSDGVFIVRWSAGVFIVRWSDGVFIVRRSDRVFRVRWSDGVYNLSDFLCKILTQADQKILWVKKISKFYTHLTTEYVQNVKIIKQDGNKPQFTYIKYMSLFILERQ